MIWFSCYLKIFVRHTRWSLLWSIHRYRPKCVAKLWSCFVMRMRNEIRTCWSPDIFSVLMMPSEAMNEYFYDILMLLLHEILMVITIIRKFYVVRNIFSKKFHTLFSASTICILARFSIYTNGKNMLKMRMIDSIRGITLWFELYLVNTIYIEIRNQTLALWFIVCLKQVISPFMFRDQSGKKTNFILLNVFVER